MSIYINLEDREFHLRNEKISYILRATENGEIEHIYFGKALNKDSNFSHLDGRMTRDTRSEYPDFGRGDYRLPAYTVIQEDGSSITNYKYDSYRLVKGKPKLKDLPATYSEDNDCETLEIILSDELIKSKIILSYSIYEDFGVICRNVRFENNGEKKLIIDNAMSASIEFTDDKFEMIHLAGAWCREAHVKVQKLNHGVQGIHSTKGASSHDNNPFIALKRFNTTENSGDVYGFSLVYSGNFLAQVEVDSYSVTRVMMGLNPFNFNWTIDSKECFQTPECIMVFSNTGLTGMSQEYHSLYKNRLVRGYWRDKQRPILLNSWEAVVFDFDEEKVLDIASAAKDVGVELFVLDDGWFGKRNNDDSSLGDWFVNKEKIPSGIDGLSKKITDMGLMFGLWFEPEMVNLDSHIAEEHPEWIIHVDNRFMTPQRNQHVLDFSQKEVIDHVFNLMDKVIEDSNISYIKWDMNRSITEAFSHGLDKDKQGELYHRYILGVYDLYERLIDKYPEILFESCASGGGRFDPGMLYYAPQTWTSDDTDAIERLKTQYGTSFVYPLNSMGSHVSHAPNYQVGRNTTLETRANVAYFGTFGYEFDIRYLSDEDKQKVKKQIKYFKKNSEIIHNGTFYRLQSPFEENIAAWMVVNKDKTEALVGVYQILAQPHPKYHTIRLEGLDSNKRYKLKDRDTVHYGDELMNLGLGISEKGWASGLFSSEDKEDFSSKIFHLEVLN